MKYRKRNYSLRKRSHWKKNMLNYYEYSLRKNTSKQRIDQCVLQMFWGRFKWYFQYLCEKPKMEWEGFSNW